MEVEIVRCLSSWETSTGIIIDSKREGVHETCAYLFDQDQMRSVRQGTTDSWSNRRSVISSKTIAIANNTTKMMFANRQKKLTNYYH
jgi:hypothetical protein